MSRLHITGTTTVQDLRRFAARVRDDAVVRGELNKDGTVTLYSTRNALAKLPVKGRELKQIAARNAITDVIAHIPGLNSLQNQKYLDTVMHNVLEMIPTGEMRGRDFKAVVGTAMGLAKFAGSLSNSLKGMTIDPDGNVGGSTTVSTIGTSDGRVLSSRDAIQENATRLVDEDMTTTENGVEVCKAFSKDRHRQDIYVNGKNIRSKDADLELLKFAKNENACKVLSACLNQSMFGNFLYSFDRPNGGGKLLTQVGRIPSVERLDITQDKFTGDYKITITYDTTAEAFGDQDRMQKPVDGDNGFYPLPLEDGDSLWLKFTAEIIVSKGEADKGNVSMQMPKDPTVTYSGKLSTGEG